MKKSLNYYLEFVHEVVQAAINCIIAGNTIPDVKENPLKDGFRTYTSNDS